MELSCRWDSKYLPRRKSPLATYIVKIPFAAYKDVYTSLAFTWKISLAASIWKFHLPEEKSRSSRKNSPAALQKIPLHYWYTKNFSMYIHMYLYPKVPSFVVILQTPALKLYKYKIKFCSLFRLISKAMATLFIAHAYLIVCPFGSKPIKFLTSSLEKLLIEPQRGAANRAHDGIV